MRNYYNQNRRLLTMEEILVSNSQDPLCVKSYLRCYDGDMTSDQFESFLFELCKNVSRDTLPIILKDKRLPLKVIHFVLILETLGTEGVVDIINDSRFDKEKVYKNISNKELKQMIDRIENINKVLGE